MTGAEGAAERVAGKQAEHIIAKAVESAGVRDAEDVAAKGAERTAGRDAAGAAGGRELSAADRTALDDYTSHHYVELNDYNRGVGTVSPQEATQLERRSQAVSDALAKLPPHEGTVYRGTNLPEDVLTNYRSGETIREDAFTSASTDRPFPGNAQYTIRSSNGKEVSGYSNVPNENEVLFDRGTRFRVLGHDVVGGVHYISLMEVP
ncbi:MAG: ADP-ribosyltransferase [Jatrophihabitantaceae bacterium]